MAWNEPGGSGKDKDPWGGGNGSGNQGPPDLDEVVKKMQEKFGSLFGGGKSGKSKGSSGGGGGGISSIGIGLILVIVAVAWGLLDGESLTLFHYLGMLLIISGIYLINYVRVSKSRKPIQP